MGSSHSKPAAQPIPQKHPELQFYNFCAEEATIQYRTDDFGPWDSGRTIAPNGDLRMRAMETYNEWRMGENDETTKLGLSVGGCSASYAIIVMPPDVRACKSLAECMAMNGGRPGFNVGVSFGPNKRSKGKCKKLVCSAYTEAKCRNARKYRLEINTGGSCSASTNYFVQLCPDRAWTTSKPTGYIPTENGDDSESDCDDAVVTDVTPTTNPPPVGRHTRPAVFT